MKKSTARITRRWENHIHSEMWHNSWVLLEFAKEKSDRYPSQLSASLLFAAFTFEGFLNTLGGEKFDCWESDLDRLSVFSKFTLIAERIGFTIDRSRRPVQTVKRLFEYRNRCAHPRVEEHVNEETVLNEEVHEIAHRRPETEWQSYVSEETVLRVREDLEELIDDLNVKAGGVRGTLNVLSRGMFSASAD